MPSDKVILFNVYKTLISYEGDYVTKATFEFFSRWFGYRGMAIDARTLMRLYRERQTDRLAYSLSEHPEVDTLEVWNDVLVPLISSPYQRNMMSIELALLWRQLTTHRLEVYPHTFEMLDACKAAGFRLAITSNAQRAYTEHELELLGLSGYFEMMLFSSDILARKPDPALFDTALRRLGVSSHQVLYVADNPYDDVLGASQAGIGTIFLDRSPTMDATFDHGARPYAIVYRNDVVRVAEHASAYFELTG